MKVYTTGYVQARELPVYSLFIHRGCLWQVTGFHEDLVIAKNTTESEGPEELETDRTTFVAVVTHQKHY